MHIKRPLFTVCLVAAGMVALVVLFFTPSLPDYGDWDGREGTVTGRVTRKEYRTSFGEKKIYLYLSECSVSFITERSPVNSEKDKKFHIMAILSDGQWEPPVGSKVCLQGEVSCFSRATNPGEFDSLLYYAAQGIDFRLVCTRVLGADQRKAGLGENLWQLRCLAGEKLDRLLTGQDAAVLKTMLLGDRQSLDGELKSLYQDTGIAHILAVSGLHISLLGLGVYRLLRRLRLPLWICAPVSVFLIVCYGVLTGAGLSAVRAVGMFGIRLLGELLGRTYDLPTALGVLMALMGVCRPLYFLNSGFLLSFGALLGIGCVYPALERGWPVSPLLGRVIDRKWHRLGRKVRNSFWSGLCVTLATLPVQMWYYYEVPVYSVLINLLVLPLMTGLMYAGIGLLVLPVGWSSVPAGWVVHGILSFYRWLCEQATCIPGNQWICGRPGIWQMVFYLITLVCLVVFQRRLKRGWRLGLLTGALAMLCIRPSQPMHITFLDVGQGDCICLELESGSNYLIDCGSSSKGDVGKYQIAPFLKHQGIGYLDGIFITHPDQDHCSGLEAILQEGYAGRVGKLLLPDIDAGQREELKELLDLAGAYGIPVYYLSAGMVWQEGETSLACLHPPGGYSSGESNEYSQVFYVRQGEFSMLLTGDVEGDGEKHLLQELRGRRIGDLTLLKVAHHGSAGSTGAALLEQLDPELAIISCGKKNPYGHPHRETLERLEAVGSRVVVTARQGAVWVQVGRKEVKVYGYGNE